MLNIDNETGIVLVKFSATWCMPCKMISSTIESVVSEFSSVVKFKEIDVDDYPDLAKKYKIRSVPTVILIKDGEESSRLVGSFKSNDLRKTIDDVIKAKAA